MALDLQVVGVVASVATSVITLIAGIAIAAGGARFRKMEKDIETCVADTKYCNQSIATLATQQAHADTSINNLIKRADAASDRMRSLQQDVTEIKTRLAVSRGDD